MEGITCCCSLKTGTITIAIIDLVLSLLGTIILIFSFATVFNDDSLESESQEFSELKSLLIAMFVICLLICIFEVLLAAFLIKAAKERNQVGLQIWLIITAIGVAIDAIALGVVYHWDQKILILLTGILKIIYVLYEIAVVYTYRKEILKPAPPPADPTVAYEYVLMQESGDQVSVGPGDQILVVKERTPAEPKSVGASAVP